jgi:hypothetical protein
MMRRTFLVPAGCMLGLVLAPGFCQAQRFRSTMPARQPTAPTVSLQPAPVQPAPTSTNTGVGGTGFGVGQNVMGGGSNFGISQLPSFTGGYLGGITGQGGPNLISTTPTGNPYLGGPFNNPFNNPYNINPYASPFGFSPYMPMNPYAFNPYGGYPYGGYPTGYSMPVNPFAPYPAMTPLGPVVSAPGAAPVNNPFLNPLLNPFVNPFLNSNIGGLGGFGGFGGGLPVGANAAGLGGGGGLNNGAANPFAGP